MQRFELNEAKQKKTEYLEISKKLYLPHEFLQCSLR